MFLEMESAILTRRVVTLDWKKLRNKLELQINDTACNDLDYRKKSIPERLNDTSARFSILYNRPLRI